VHEAAHIERASFDRMPGAEEQEFRLIVDEELHQLPAKFREPLVLCYLEGKTNEEAARELGCPAGTVFSRLARGRERLRKQLARRGLVLTAGLIAASLAAHSAPAAVPPVLAAATLKAATAFAIGTPAAVGTIAAGVVSLTDATIRTLFLLQLKHMAMIAVVAVVLAAGGGLITYSVYDEIFSERSTAARVDARQLQGIWRVVVQEQDGQELSEERLQSANSRMIFVGNQLRHRDTAPNGQDVGQDVTFTLDPTQSPKAIDLKRNGQKLFGIYELDGETLKVCVDKNPGHRPREFSTQKGSQRILHVLKRADTAVPK
jgi:RNA polymerase sigma-70 factor (ECF subfamily)